MSRPSFIEFKDRANEYLRQYTTARFVCAEVGVHIGDNAIEMLEERNDFNLYLIDDYKNICTTTYNEDRDIRESPEDSMKIKEVAIERFAPYRGRAIQIFEPSIEASKRFPDNFFHYVYIDANHVYKNVFRDITHWYPKIKKGWALTGHDWEVLGVSNAVTDFCTKHNLLHNFRVKGCDWVIVK